jgi:hypothetical protein
MPVTPASPDLSQYRREEILRDGYRVIDARIMLK